MTESPHRRRPFRRIVLGSVLLIHAIAYWWLVFRLQYFDGLPRVIAIGVMLGQCSLVAIMSTFVREAKPVRIAMPWIAALAAWYGISNILYWGLGEAGATWWAIAITAQTIVCIVGANVLQTHCKNLTSSPDAKTKTTPLQFPIRTLMVLTTMAALGFAVTDYGRRCGWWSTDSLSLIETAMMVVVGSTVALTALIGLVAVASRKKHVVAVRLCGAVVLVPLLGFLLHEGTVRAGLDGSPDSRPAMVLLAAHLTCVLITWLIVDRLPEPFS